GEIAHVQLLTHCAFLKKSEPGVPWLKEPLTTRGSSGTVEKRQGNEARSITTTARSARPMWRDVTRSERPGQPRTRSGRRKGRPETLSGPVSADEAVPQRGEREGYVPHSAHSLNVVSLRRWPSSGYNSQRRHPRATGPV